MARIFVPFRAAGFVTTDTPYAISRVEKDYFIVTSVGCQFHEYRGDTLHLITVSPQLPHKIRALAMCGRYVAVGCRNKIHVFQQNRLLYVVEHSPIGKVSLLLANAGVLMCIGYDNVLSVFDMVNGARMTTLTFPHGSTITSACLPTGYVNKLLVGTKEGHMDLWNVRKGIQLFRFNNLGAPITCLQSGPVVDVVAAGLEDGRVVIYNIGCNEMLFTFTHTPAVRVTAISFRNDGIQQLASGTAEGEIALWDLEKRRLAGLLSNTTQSPLIEAKHQNPHRGTVTNLTFFAGEPILLSGGADNALREFLFDALGTSHMLRERQGHFRPCTKALFVTETLILSASEDRTLRMRHVLVDEMNRELSQGSIESTARKLVMDAMEMRATPVVAVAVCLARRDEWAAILTAHEGTARVRCWRLDKLCLDEFVIHPPSKEKSPATTVAISRCGSLGFVGLANGQVHSYSLQAQALRKTFSDPRLAHLVPPHMATKHWRLHPAHEGPVVGLFVPELNNALVSAGEDGNINVWDMREATLLRSLYTGYRLSKAATFSPDNQLLAIGCDDHSVRVYDVSLEHNPADILRPESTIAAPTPEQTPSILVSGIQKLLGRPKGSRHKRPLAMQQLPRPPDGGNPILYAAAKKMSQRASKSGVATPVRTLRGHTSAISAVLFTPDNTLLLTASTDSTMRVHHIATDRLVDIYRFAKPVTSLSMHPDSLFLATTHEGSVCVCLWTNMLKYGFVPKLIKDESKVLAARGTQALPFTVVDSKNDQENQENDDDEVFKVLNQDENGEPEEGQDQFQDISEVVAVDANQIEEQKGDLLTFSGTPRPKWTLLPNMDLVVKRNKPVQPPKKVQAPFFMPTKPGVQPEWLIPASDPKKGDEPAEKKRKIEKGEGEFEQNWSAETETDEEKKGSGSEGEEESEGGEEVVHSRILRFDEVMQLTPLMKLIDEGDHDAAMEMLLPMPASKIDFEIRDIEGIRSVSNILEFLLHHLRKKTNFEVVQAVFGVVLRIHGEYIANTPELSGQIQELVEGQQSSWKDVGHLVTHNLCLIKWFTKSL